MSPVRGRRAAIDSPDCPISLELQQTAYALGWSKWAVRKCEQDDPTFPKRKTSPWNPKGPGKFDRDEIRAWLAARRVKSLAS